MQACSLDPSSHKRWFLSSLLPRLLLVSLTVLFCTLIIHGNQLWIDGSVIVALKLYLSWVDGFCDAFGNHFLVV